MAKENKIGIVYWEDAQTLRKEEDLPKVCPIMKSIGVIHKMKNYILVVSLVAPDDSCGVSTIIPKGCLKRIQWLK